MDGNGGGAAWPVIAGSYTVGDPGAPVAVCALTSERLVDPLARLPGVAIAGKVYTANLGIERIVVNVTANPAIRFFLICGKDSPLFRPGQSLVALAERGVDDQRRIVGAAGYDPVLPTLAPERVARFRRQVEVLDWTGVEDLDAIERGVRALAARNPGRFASGEDAAAMAESEERFVPIRPGGTREPLQYDPKGYFVITLDREEEQIVLRHYLPDHTPAHEMRGRMAGSMLLGLLREGLVSQLSHAGYLGGELAKAQAALTLGLRYDQDRPLRGPEAPAGGAAGAAPSPAEAAPGAEPATPAAAASAAMPPMGRIAPPMTPTELRAVAPGGEANVALAVDELVAPDPAVNGGLMDGGLMDGGLMGGALLEPDEAEPFSAFRRTSHGLRVRWTAATRIVMGDAADLRVGALVRARGTLGPDGVVDAQGLVILTRVARITHE